MRIAGKQFQIDNFVKECLVKGFVVRVRIQSNRRDLGCKGQQNHKEECFSHPSLSVSMNRPEFAVKPITCAGQCARAYQRSNLFYLRSNNTDKANLFSSMQLFYLSQI